ncbi:hypothetical protein JB92DRAFT_2938716 [Gautieria morchelliformis]|nr:hypothetical protein JB92DRAFT_2938716 [Gautieria morchelliformis]
MGWRVSMATLPLPSCQALISMASVSHTTSTCRHLPGLTDPRSFRLTLSHIERGKKMINGLYNYLHANVCPSPHSSTFQVQKDDKLLVPAVPTAGSLCRCAMPSTRGLCQY